MVRSAIAIFALLPVIAGAAAGTASNRPLLTYFLGSPFSAPGGGGLCGLAFTSPAIRLTNPTNEQMPTWSPDGSRVAYFRTGVEGAEVDLWVADANGRNARNLTSGYSGWNDDPSWSPDGTTIAFAARSDHGSLVAMRPDGSDKRVLATTSLYGVIGTPAWSPDGNEIAFSKSDVGEPSGTYIVNADGTSSHLVAANAFAPSWSPDGRKLTMTTEHAIVVADANGSNVHSIRDRPPWPVLGMGLSRWSPDGTTIAFSQSDIQASTGALRDQVWVMKVDGSDAHAVAGDRELGAYDPAWRAPTPLPRDLGRPCTLRGSTRANVLVGTKYGDVILGESGHDIIRGRGGPDLIIGGPGRDRLYGGAGNDSIDARDRARDFVDGGAGRDRAAIDRSDRVISTETVNR